MLNLFTNKKPNESPRKSVRTAVVHQDPFCDGCKCKLESNVIRMQFEFDMCGTCGRSQDGKPTLLRMKAPTLDTYRVYLCNHGEQKWAKYTCDFCSQGITGINLYQQNYDLCEDCYHGNCLPEVQRWTSSFVLGRGGAGQVRQTPFQCNGCRKKDMTTAYLPNFFICEACAARPKLLSGLLKSLPCRLHRPPKPSFTNWLGTDRGDAMQGNRDCHVCSVTIPENKLVYAINYGLCEECVAEPPATVRAQFRGLFRRCVLAGATMPNWEEMYIPTGVLGQGSFGQVFKVRSSSSNTQFALKVVPLRGMDETERRYMVGEAELLLAMKHANIVEGVEAFVDKSLHLNIVMELGLGDLAGFIKKMSGLDMTVLAWAVLLHVTRGVAYLHELNVLHRDIKPANILAFMDNELVTFKLVDLGIARPMSDMTYVATSHGTPVYMAPEMMTKDKGSSQSSDMWAVGCVVYEVLFAKSPFWENDDGVIEAYRKMEHNIFRIPNGTNSALAAIMRGLLQFHPQRRLSANQVLDRIEQEQRKSNLLYDQIRAFGIDC